MTINEVNLESLSRDEFLDLIKIIILSFRYIGFEFNNKELEELENLIFIKNNIKNIKI